MARSSNCLFRRARLVFQQLRPGNMEKKKGLHCKCDGAHFERGSIGTLGVRSGMGWDEICMLLGVAMGKNMEKDISQQLGPFMVIGSALKL